MFWKKGSLDLSVNAIVVLILAVTMLGLALAFINMVFGQAQDLTGGQIDKIRQNELDAFMAGCDETFCVEKSNLELKKNGQVDLFLVINNKFDCDLKTGSPSTKWSPAQIFIGGIQGGSKNFPDTSGTCYIIDKTGYGASCKDISIQALPEKTVKANSKDFVTLRVNVGNTAKTTIYTYDVQVKGACQAGSPLTDFSFDERETIQIDVQG